MRFIDVCLKRCERLSRIAVQEKLLKTKCFVCGRNWLVVMIGVDRVRIVGIP